MYVWDGVITGRDAEVAGAGASLLHEELVPPALAVLGPAGAHHVAVGAAVVQHPAAVARLGAVDVHVVGVVDALALPRPPGAAGGGVAAFAGGCPESHREG